MLALSIVAERVLAHPFLRKTFEIELRTNNLRLILEALGLCQDVAVLCDQRMAVPREIRG